MRGILFENVKLMMIKGSNQIGHGIRHALNPKCIGREILFFEELDSTNSKAKELAIEGAVEGTCIISSRQYNGKGRFGRTWCSPRSGVWLSVILSPDIEPERAPLVTILAGIAVARTIREVCELEAKIKWPNDILIHEKKVCGILTEVICIGDDVKHMILGIGVNANFNINELPKDVRNSATTLKNELGHDVSNEEFITKLLQNLDKCYEQFKNRRFRELVEEWKKLSATLGREVKITDGKEAIQGLALEIDEFGALIVEGGNGRPQRIITGDCIHISRP